MQPAASVLAAATRQRRCTIAAYRPRIMSGAHTSLLVALCKFCHFKVEQAKKGAKGNANAKEAMLADMFEQETARLERRFRSRRGAKKG